MAIPNFTNEELYLVNSVKASDSSYGSYSLVWAYITASTAIAGFAVYHENLGMAMTAFALVCGFRIYEELGQKKWTPVWRSVINKYECAVAVAGEMSSGDGPAATID